jgi:CheY-like chemotaxis protein
MDNSAIYLILKDIIGTFAAKDRSYQQLPDSIDESASLNDLGLDITTLPEVLAEFQARVGGKDLQMDDVLNPSDVNSMTLGDLLREIRTALGGHRANPVVVYVDDEEENLFIFTRKFGKQLNLKTFTDPVKAFEFIKSDGSVALVITDEVMPNLNGNALCDAVHKVKPTMKFVLITGNPNTDDDLMYRSLRKNRFYEFINKPLDLANKGDEYLALFKGLVSTEL